MIIDKIILAHIVDPFGIVINSHNKLVKSYLASQKLEEQTAITAVNDQFFEGTFTIFADLFWKMATDVWTKVLKLILVLE